MSGKALLIEAYSGEAYTALRFRGTWAQEEDAGLGRLRRPRVTVARKAKIGDLVWCGMSIKIATETFIDSLSKVGVSGFHTFEIDLFGTNIDHELVGLVINGTPWESDLWAVDKNLSMSHFWAKKWVVEELRDVGRRSFHATSGREFGYKEGVMY